MAVYLNTNKNLENYKELYNEEYFVDKSKIISLINKKINTKSKYLCITRPRRFGKSSIANMLGAYYSKVVDSKDIFDNLYVNNCESYKENLNKYNVITISFTDVNNNCKNCGEYIDRIIQLLIQDLKEVFPNIKIKPNYAIWDILNELNEKFIFIFDEWDYIFNRNLYLEEQDKFLEFLMKLLKDKSYVALCYMTGILPIKKYSTGSALNMFDEYTFLKDRIFDEYFGFTSEEVISLCEKNDEIKFSELENWYNGYLTIKGKKIYNPRSVVKALQNKHCESYWTNTGAMDEVAEYLKYNTMEIREDVIEMVSGGEIDIIINEEFRAGQEAQRQRKKYIQL